jgi:hypothetical protein
VRERERGRQAVSTSRAAEGGVSAGCLRARTVGLIRVLSVAFAAEDGRRGQCDAEAPTQAQPACSPACPLIRLPEAVEAPRGGPPPPPVQYDGIRRTLTGEACTQLSSGDCAYVSLGDCGHTAPYRTQLAVCRASGGLLSGGPREGGRGRLRTGACVCLCVRKVEPLVFASVREEEVLQQELETQKERGRGSDGEREGQ